MDKSLCPLKKRLNSIWSHIIFWRKFARPHLAVFAFRKLKQKHRSGSQNLKIPSSGDFLNGYVQDRRIELLCTAWKAVILPLN